MRLSREIGTFTGELSAFIKNFKLPPEWFEMPDHVGVTQISPKNRTHLPKIQEAIPLGPIKREAVATQLARWLTVPKFGSVAWLEVEGYQPSLSTKYGFDHLAFQYEDTFGAYELLRRLGVPHSLRSGEATAAVHIPLTTGELELTGVPLGTISETPGLRQLLNAPKPPTKLNYRATLSKG